MKRLRVLYGLAIISLFICVAATAQVPANAPAFLGQLNSLEASTCLASAGLSGGAGALLNVASCDQVMTTSFAFVPQSDGSYVVQLPRTASLCMDLNDTGQLVAFYCIPTASQHWTPKINSADYSFSVVNSASSQCLSTEGGASSFVMAPCDGSNEQRFYAKNAQPYLSSKPATLRQLPPVPVAQPTPGLWQAGMYKSMPYRIMFPSGYDPAHQVYPLVLILHGIGQRGTDNMLQLATDIGALANDLDFRANAPFIMVAPQCPTNDDWGAASNSAPSTSEALAVELVQQLTQALAVDSTRVSVTGLSLGGIGTWDIIHRYPAIFAAAAPLAGAGLPSEAPDLVNVPILAVHGQLDFTVPAYFDEQMYAAIHALGGKMIYYEMPFTTHDVWDGVYPLTAFWEWIYAQQHD